MSTDAVPPGHMRLGTSRSVQNSPSTVIAVVVSNIGAGLAALVMATLIFDIHPTIAAPWSLPGVDPLVMGTVLWAGVCLATSLLATEDRQTFGTGSILGAALLGGPVAAVWVAVIGTVDRRELRGAVPWYGIASNHGQMAWTALAGALIMLSIRPVLGKVNPAVDFAAILAAFAVFLVANAAATVLIDNARTGRSIRESFDVVDLRDWSMWSLVETCVAFVVALAFWGGAWWSLIVLFVLDLAVSRSLVHYRSTWQIKHHPITNLPNAIGLQEHARALRREEPAPTEVRVMYLDLDGFKSVNDRCGHQAGDEVLKIVGKRLGAVSRRESFVAHLHGDEFAVLLLNADEATGDRLGDELREIIEEPIAILRRHGIRISASSGHAAVTDLLDLKDAMREADAIMERRKQARARADGRERRRQ